MMENYKSFFFFSLPRVFSIVYLLGSSFLLFGTTASFAGLSGDDHGYCEHDGYPDEACEYLIIRQESEDPAQQGQESEDPAQQGQESEDPAQQGQESEDPAQQGQESEDPAQQGQESEDPAQQGQESEDPAQQGDTVVRLGDVGTAGEQLDGLKPLYIDPNWDQESGLHLVGSDSCWLQCAADATAADATAADATDNPDASVSSEGRPMVFLGETIYGYDDPTMAGQEFDGEVIEVYDYAIIYVDSSIYFIGDATSVDIDEEGMVYPDEAYYLDTLEPIVLTGDMAGFPVRYNAAPVFRVAPAFEPLLIDVSREQLWDTGRIIIPTGAFDANGDQLSFSVYQYSDDGSQYRPSDDYYQQSRNQNIFTLDSPLPGGEWPVMLRDLSDDLEQMISTIDARKADPSAEITEPMHLVQLLKDLHIIQARFNNGDNDNNDVSEPSQLFSINDDYQLVVRQGANIMFPRTPHEEAYMKLAVVASDGYNQTVQPFEIRITTQHYYDLYGQQALSDPLYYFFREYLHETGLSLDHMAQYAVAQQWTTGSGYAEALAESEDIELLIDNLEVSMYGDGADIDDTVRHAIYRQVLKYLLLSSANDVNYHDYFADPDSPLWYNGRVFKRLARPGLEVGSHYPVLGAPFMTVGKLIDTVSAKLATTDGLAIGQYSPTVRRRLVYRYLASLDPVIARTELTEPLLSLPDPLTLDSGLSLEGPDIYSEGSEAPEEQNTEWDVYQTYYGDLAWAQLYTGLSLLNRDGEDVSEKSKQEVMDYLANHFSSIGEMEETLSTQQQADIIYPSVLLADAHSIINTWRDPDPDPDSLNLREDEFISLRYAPFMGAHYQDLFDENWKFMNDGQDIHFPDASLGGIDDQLSLIQAELSTAKDYYQQAIKITRSFSNMEPSADPAPSIPSVARQILQDHGVNPNATINMIRGGVSNYITDTYLNLYLRLYYGKDETTIRPCTLREIASYPGAGAPSVGCYAHGESIELPDPWPVYSTQFDAWTNRELSRIQKAIRRHIFTYTMGSPYVPAWSGKSIMHAHFIADLASSLQEADSDSSEGADNSSVVVPSSYHSPLYTAVISTHPDDADRLHPAPERVLLLFGTVDDLMASIIVSRHDEDTDEHGQISSLSVDTRYDSAFCSRTFSWSRGDEPLSISRMQSTRAQSILFSRGISWGPGNPYSTVCFDLLRQYWMDHVSPRLANQPLANQPPFSDLDNSVAPALFESDSSHLYIMSGVAQQMARNAASWETYWSTSLNFLASDEGALRHQDLYFHGIYPLEGIVEDMVDEQSSEDIVDEQSSEDMVDEQSSEDMVDEQSSEDIVDEQSSEDIVDEQSSLSMEHALLALYRDHVSSYKEAQLADKSTAETMRDALESLRYFPILSIFYLGADMAAASQNGESSGELGRRFLQDYVDTSIGGATLDNAVESAINGDWGMFTMDMFELAGMAITAGVGALETAPAMMAEASESTLSLPALDTVVAGESSAATMEAETSFTSLIGNLEEPVGEVAEVEEEGATGGIGEGATGGEEGGATGGIGEGATGGEEGGATGGEEGGATGGIGEGATGGIGEGATGGEEGGATGGIGEGATGGEEGGATGGIGEGATGGMETPSEELNEDVNVRIANRSVTLRKIGPDWREVDPETDLTRPNGPTYARNPNNPAQFVRSDTLGQGGMISPERGEPGTIFLCTNNNDCITRQGTGVATSEVTDIEMQHLATAADQGGTTGTTGITERTQLLGDHNYQRFLQTNQKLRIFRSSRGGLSRIRGRARLAIITIGAAGVGGLIYGAYNLIRGSFVSYTTHKEKDFYLNPDTETAIGSKILNHISSGIGNMAGIQHEDTIYTFSNIENEDDDVALEYFSINEKTGGITVKKQLEENRKYTLNVFKADRSSTVGGGDLIFVAHVYVPGPLSLPSDAPNKLTGEISVDALPGEAVRKTNAESNDPYPFLRVNIDKFLQDDYIIPFGKVGSAVKFTLKDSVGADLENDFPLAIDHRGRIYLKYKASSGLSTLGENVELTVEITDVVGQSVHQDGISISITDTQSITGTEESAAFDPYYPTTIDINSDDVYPGAVLAAAIPAFNENYRYSYSLDNTNYAINDLGYLIHVSGNIFGDEDTVDVVGDEDTAAVVGDEDTAAVVGDEDTVDDVVGVETVTVSATNSDDNTQVDRTFQIHFGDDYPRHTEPVIRQCY